MYITQHAAERIDSRLTFDEGTALLEALEGTPGEPGVVAYVAATLQTPVRCDDGSNGDTVVVVAVDGSVETVFFRRSRRFGYNELPQRLNAESFGARKVVPL